MPKMNEEPRAEGLSALFSLRRDQARPEVIDADIRGGMLMAGTNLWVLMFAIVIASVGLNVNSTAVIIGAMLISPLMGPIIGVGYGAAIQDSRLIRRSLRNLAVFAGISLATSTLYFLLTPLSQAQSELLARTSPTIWDVLIAFFGGAAGMVGLTRREKTTLIPGVAIATALMPPLCTAGYGLATGQWRFFFGAFYLFTINGVFIAFATLVIARVLRLPLHAYADEAARRRGRLWIGAAVTVTLLPSIVLAVQLVRDEWFVTRAGRYLASLEASHKDLVLLSRDIDARRHRISVTLLGSGITPELQRGLEAQLPDFGLQEARLEIRHATETPRDAAGGGQARALQQDVQRQTMLQLQERQARLEVLEQQIRQLDAEEADHARLAQEISAQWPAARGVSVARAAAGVPAARRLLVVIDAPHAVPAAEVQRLKRWLAVRLQDAEFILVVGKAAG